MTAALKKTIIDATRQVATRWINDAKNWSKGDTFGGLRRSPRYQWRTPITVEILEGRDAGICCYANTQDISLGGLGFSCRQKLEQGVLICICDDNGDAVFGRVRHCEKNITTFQVGIEFTS